MHTIRTSLLVLGSALLIAASAGAQVNSAVTAGPHNKTISLIAGVSQFDLSGTGMAPIVGARADMEINRWFVGEVGFTAMRPLEQFGQRATYILPELQLQAQLPLSVVRPYLGLGAGASFAQETERTVAVAGGARVLLPGTSTALRAELRVRGIRGDFSGSMAEWTLGVGRRF